MNMKKGLLLLTMLLLIFGIAAASTKDDNRIKVAERALSEGKYIEAKATFEDLKDNPQYRQKCYLYLAMIYYQGGQIENSLVSLADFKRYVTEKTDVSLIKASENLNNEIDKNYGVLDVAIFEGTDRSGVDPGFYNLTFKSDGGLNPAQEARLKVINRVLSQSQGLFSWKSDGTFLKGQIRNFPIRMYDTSPMTAEVNGVPVYFRFDFQTQQGLWIPENIIKNQNITADTSLYRESEFRESEEIFVQPQKPAGNSKRMLLLFGVAAALVAGIAVAVTR